VNAWREEDQKITWGISIQPAAVFSSFKYSLGCFCLLNFFGRVLSIVQCVCCFVHFLGAYTWTLRGFGGLAEVGLYIPFTAFVFGTTLYGHYGASISIGFAYPGLLRCMLGAQSF
jgi:hypothetical protein